MRGVTVSMHYDVDLTAEDWGLYCDNKDAPVAAAHLNHIVKEMCNTKLPKEEKLLQIYQVQKRYRECGAADSEVFDAIEKILNIARASMS